MNKLIIILFITFTSFCHAQSFYVKDSADIITVNVPFPFKAYTFSQYSLTDTSIIISSDRKDFDLIVRNPHTDKNLTLVFPPSDKPRIRGKEFYQLKIGEPVIFVISADQTYFLSSSQKISFGFIVDEFGDLVEFKKIPAGENFFLSPGRTYGFEFFPAALGNTNVELNLYKNNQIVETKKFPVLVNPNDIELRVETNIEHLRFEKRIHYKILPSSPPLADLELSITLEVETNGFHEFINIEHLFFQKGSPEFSGFITKNIKGRQPRSMSVKKIDMQILPETSNTNYHFKTINL